jgi:hypothetical protein
VECVLGLVKTCSFVPVQYGSMKSALFLSSSVVLAVVIVSAINAAQMITFM